MNSRMINPRTILVFSMFLGACTDKKQSTEEEAPTDTNDYVEPYWDDVSELLEPIRSEYGLPGLGAARIQDGAIIALGTVGLRSSEAEPSVTHMDKWHLGSCTKAMTATLAGIFVDRGELSWLSTVGELFPDIDIDEGYEGVTVEMLLSHRAGTWSNLTADSGLWTSLYEDGDVQEQRLDVVEAVLTEPPEVEPGSLFLYSNSGYIIVGAALERLSAESWESLMRTHVFDPLGMDSCGFGATDPTGELLHPWGHSAEGPVNPVTDWADNPPALGPAGTVHCNLIDWSDFIVEQLRGYNGEGTLLSNEQYAHMFTSQGDDYAMGWGIVQRSWADGDVFVHSGSNTINRSVVWAAPNLDGAYLAVSNVGSEEALYGLDEAVGVMIGLE